MFIARLVAIAMLAALPLCLPAGAGEFRSDRITVVAVGEGEDVVLVPGLGSSPAVWDHLVAALPQYRFHLVQVNGFAGAPAGANASGPVLPGVAAEIARYIDAADLGPVPLIGHSFGGSTGIAVASEYPAAVERLMVVDVPAFMGGIMGATPETVVELAQGMMAMSASLDDGSRQQQDTAFVAASVRTESERGAVLEAMLASDPAVVRQVMYDVTVADLRSALGNIGRPVTVLFALPAGAPGMDAEQITGFYQAEYGAAADLTLQFVEEAGHFIMLDQPTVFAEAVATFLE